MPTPDDGGMPRWPRSTSISPTALKTFRQCAHRTRLKYVDRIAVVEPFSLFLAAGRIAHDILRLDAQAALAKRPFMSEEWTFERAFHRLPKREFPSAEEHVKFARRITRWVGNGLREIDRDATFINIERYGQMKQRVDGELLTFNARPDLVIYHADADGEMVVDFIDYKTGSPWPDDVTILLVRQMIRNEVLQVVGPDIEVRMRWIWAWLEHDERQVIELDRAFFETGWPTVMTEVRGLVQETVWPAQPGYLCNYCPYRGTAHCTAAMPPER